MSGIREQQRERTRRALLTAARDAFTEHGYANVSLPAVVAAAGVTKGALYHHFSSREELFLAVVAELQDELGEHVAAEADAVTDPWDGLVRGCLAFLHRSTAPDVAQILLIDGPAVLGWTQWRALDAAGSEQHLREALEDLVLRGEVTGPAEPLVHLLSGAVNQAAVWVAASADPTDLAEAERALETLLTGLHLPPTPLTPPTPPTPPR